MSLKKKGITNEMTPLIVSSKTALFKQTVLNEQKLASISKALSS